MLAKKPTVGLVVLALVLLVTACAAGPNALSTSTRPEVAGFWLGLWHGFISPVTFIVSLFTSRVNIYEVVNNGNWYNFGFMVGVSAVFSGTAGTGRAARSASGRRRSRG